MLEIPVVLAGSTKLTGCVKLLVSDDNVDRRRLAFCILGAAREKAPGHKFVDALLLGIEAVASRMCGGVDRRMGFIVLLAVAGPLELALDEAVPFGFDQLDLVRALPRQGDSPLSKSAPLRIDRLLPDQAHKVKVLVVLIRLGTRVAQESALV